MDEKELEALKASSPKAYESYMALKGKEDAWTKEKADLESKLKAAVPPKKEDDDDLATKARKEREAKEKDLANQSNLEKALKFNLGGAQFMKDNAALLPKSVSTIFEAAEKENYGTATEKAAAIKVGIISEFFALEENMSHLTGPQKVKVEEFKKLTKTDKQDRAGVIWDEIFEPTFETLKKVKRAQTMAAGEKYQSDGEKALAERMAKMSRKHYLGEKNA